MRERSMRDDRVNDLQSRVRLRLINNCTNRLQIRGDEHGIDAATSQLIYHEEHVYRVAAKQGIFHR